MYYCRNCGHMLEEGIRFCPSCGTPVYGADAEMKSSGTAEAIRSAENEDTEKLFAVLSYFGILVLIPAFSSRKSGFVRFHANQGLVLLLAETAAWIVGAMIHAVLLTVSWRLFLVASLWNLIWIPLTVLSVMGIVNALKGLRKKLPLIGKFNLLK